MKSSSLTRDKFVRGLPLEYPFSRSFPRRERGLALFPAITDEMSAGANYFLFSRNDEFQSRRFSSGVEESMSVDRSSFSPLVRLKERYGKSIFKETGSALH